MLQRQYQLLSARETRGYQSEIAPERCTLSDKLLDRSYPTLLPHRPPPNVPPYEGNLTSPNAMSLSDIPRNHFDPLSHFPPREEHFSGYFAQPLSPPAFVSHGISQLSNAFYAHHPAIFNMNALSQEEMERYQELSNKYEPELTVRHPGLESRCFVPN